MKTKGIFKVLWVWLICSICLGSEENVLKSTIKKSEVYFGGRTTIGTPIRYPFLCYMLLTKHKELLLLKRNIAAFGYRCQWAISANTAKGLMIKVEVLNRLADRVNTSIVYTQVFHKSGYLVKTPFWKNITMLLRHRYSHVWFMDADIQFVSHKYIEAIETDWLCGSVTGVPPLISQPTIRNDGELQDYPQVNYYSHYRDSHISTIGTYVVENQVVLADMNYLYWLFSEIIEPYFEPIPEYKMSAWGLSRTWCRAAEDYILLSSSYYGENATRPLPCGITPHSVLHVSTHGITKTDAFYKTSRSMARQIHGIFPRWNKPYSRPTGYPGELLRLVDKIRWEASNDTVRHNTPPAAGGVCAGKDILFGNNSEIWAYAWAGEN